MLRDSGLRSCSVHPERKVVKHAVLTMSRPLHMPNGIADSGGAEGKFCETVRVSDRQDACLHSEKRQTLFIS